MSFSCFWNNSTNSANVAKNIAFYRHDGIWMTNRASLIAEVSTIPRQSSNSIAERWRDKADPIRFLVERTSSIDSEPGLHVRLFHCFSSVCFVFVSCAVCVSANPESVDFVDEKL